MSVWSRFFDEPLVRLQNGGSLLNKGWEIDLTGTILRTNQVTWNSPVHFTKAQSIVQSLDVERVALTGFQSISSNCTAFYMELATCAMSKDNW